MIRVCLILVMLAGCTSKGAVDSADTALDGASDARRDAASDAASEVASDPAPESGPAEDAAADAPADAPTEPDRTAEEPASDGDTALADADAAPDSIGGPLPDFRPPGPHTPTLADATFTTSGGCTLDYVLATPASWEVLVVLVHGLQRTNAQMRSTAEHLATWGLAVAAPTSCYRTVLDIDQEQNGIDAAELAAALTDGPVLYAGHSAGGLAAFHAAAHDPAAIGFFGLDPVEAQGIAAASAELVEVPAYAALAEPLTCNLANNFAPILATVADSRVVRVTDADHCDFEEPTDLVCTIGCGTGSNERFSDDEIRATIRALLTAFLVWVGGVDTSGSSWWTPGGEGYEALRAAGTIGEL